MNKTVLQSGMTKVLVHAFTLGDVEDPAIYAAQPIYEWQQTEAGKWVMEHSCPEPQWLTGFNTTSYGYHVRIIAQFSEQDATYFHLKYGH